jgi:hydroxymethylpyrimidine/phosphomethylpyrimidine kinase
MPAALPCCCGWKGGYAQICGASLAQKQQRVKRATSQRSPNFPVISLIPGTRHHASGNKQLQKPNTPIMTTNPSVPAVALSIAGSDSGGGAGIQADLRSFAAFGVHGTTAITAVTAQNTCGVTHIEMLSTTSVRAQMEAVLTDFPVRAIKTGMLGSPELAQCVREALEPYPNIPFVVDPVLIATTGAALSRGDMVEAMKRELLPRADLLTPNLPEAEQLLGRSIQTRADMLSAANELKSLGARAVLLKGGHLEGETVNDLLLSAEATLWFSHARINAEGHGTGCSLASAITAGLALGMPLDEAVREGIDFVHKALALAYRPGQGRIHVLNHLAAR